MAGSIVNLEDLVPGLEGKTFRIPSGVDESGAKKYADYHVPGDLDSETVFEFLKLFEDMLDTQKKAAELQDKATEGGADAEQAALSEMLALLKELNDVVKAKLLAVFQIANPELTALPFGSATTLVVLGEILEMMGLAQPELPMPPDPPKRGRRPADRKPKPARKPKAATTS